MTLKTTKESLSKCQMLMFFTQLSSSIAVWLGLLKRLTQKTRLTFLKGLVKMKISKPVRHSFIFGTQIKIFLMISESSQTLHCQQCNCNIPSPSLPPFWKLPWRVRTLSSERNQCNQRCLCSGESAHMLNVNNTDYVDYVLRKAHACVMVLSKMAEDGNSGRRIVEKNVLFVFFAHKKYSRSFAKLKLSHWCHMDYFIDVLATFLGLGTLQLRCCLWRVRELSDFIKNILIYVPKMNEGLTGLERYEGE